MAAAKLIIFVIVILEFCGVWCHPDEIAELMILMFMLCVCSTAGDRLINNVGIIGGHQISIEKVPYMVSLRLNATHHWCGGSIIHEQFILTAAHCIVPNREYKILVGTENVDGNGELYDIEKIIKHEKYEEKNHGYDVCLIKLKKPLTFSSKVSKINLANGSVKLKTGTMLNVTGWGSTGSYPYSAHLLQTSIPLISKYKCMLIYLKNKYVIAPHMICAGKLGHDSCQGDSGGPLTLGDIQVGVTSFGLGCGTVPGVYIKISSILSWIMTTMELYQ